jgi:hypothetical protein
MGATNFVGLLILCLILTFHPAFGEPALYCNATSICAPCPDRRSDRACRDTGYKQVSAGCAERRPVKNLPSPPLPLSLPRC